MFRKTKTVVLTGLLGLLLAPSAWGVDTFLNVSQADSKARATIYANQGSSVVIRSSCGWSRLSDRRLVCSKMVAADACSTGYWTNWDIRLSSAGNVYVYHVNFDLSLYC